MVVFPLFCLRQSPWRACNGDSERLEEESLPRTAGIEKSIKPELDDVLDYHPREVISPDKAYDSPGSDGTSQPRLHINTAAIWVATMAKKSLELGYGGFQKTPRVRVTNNIRCPPATSCKNIIVCSCGRSK